jgi:hypothetical protein
MGRWVAVSIGGLGLLLLPRSGETKKGGLAAALLVRLGFAA